MVPSLGNLASFGVSTMDVSVSITVTLMLLRGNPWTLWLTGGYLLYILQTIARIHSSPIHGCHCCNVLVPRNQNGVACNFCTGAEGNTIEAVLGIASFCGGNSGQLLYLCSWCPGCSLCRGPWTRTATEKREVHIGCGDPVTQCVKVRSASHGVIQAIIKVSKRFQTFGISRFPIWSRLKSGGHSWNVVIRRPTSHSSGRPLQGKMNILTRTHTFSCIKFLGFTTKRMTLGQCKRAWTCRTVVAKVIEAPMLGNLRATWLREKYISVVPYQSPHCA